MGRLKAGFEKKCLSGLQTGKKMASSDWAGWVKRANYNPIQLQGTHEAWGPGEVNMKTKDVSRTIVICVQKWRMGDRPSRPSLRK